MMNSLTIASCVISITICANESVPQEPGRETPELAFATYKTSIGKEDWGALYSVLSSGYRDYLIIEAAFFLGMRSDFDEEAKRIITKYVDQKKVDELASNFKPRPTNQQVTAIYLQAIEDKRGMFMESHTFLHSRDRNESGERFGRLLGLRVSEDVATARTKHTSTVVSYSNDGRGSPDIRNEHEVTLERDVYFIKVDGKWFFATENECRQRKMKKSESPEDAAK